MFSNTLGNPIANWTYTEDGCGYTAMGRTFCYETGTTVIADSVVKGVREANDFLEKLWPGLNITLDMMMVSC